MTEGKLDRKQNLDCGSLVVALPGVKLWVMAKKPSKRPRFFKDWRQHRKLTLDQLADLSGLSVSMISLLERGKRDYSEETLFSLAESLDCEVGDLFRHPRHAELAKYLRGLDAGNLAKALRMIRSAFDDETDELVPKTAKRA